MKRWGPVGSTPPKTRAADTYPWYRKRWERRRVCAVMTRDCRLVSKRWSSRLAEIMDVTCSVSAAVPAPQQ